MPAARRAARRQLASLVIVAFVAAIIAAPAQAQNTEVDLELVLAVDVSGSMDMREHAAQRSGYVDAFRHHEVIQAIRNGLTGRIAVAYVEWAGFGLQAVVVPWMMIEDEASAEAFAAALEGAPINEFPGTSISGGLTYSLRQFENSGYSGIRRVIDVSGDGPNNRGRPVLEARQEVLDAGITINGLPIILGRAGGSLATDLLSPYYEDCVIGGPGAFLISVDDINRLAEAIRRKLVLEIVSLPPSITNAGASASDAAPVLANERPIDCLIGEKLRRNWFEDP